MYVRCVNEAPGTCIHFDGDHDGPTKQIRDFDVTNVRIENFDIGVRACSLRYHSQITGCPICARIGFWHEGKSAEVSINDCMFEPISTADTTSAGIYCFDSDSNIRPEGLFVSNCTITYFNRAIKVATSCLQLNFANCWLETTSADGVVVELKPQASNTGLDGFIMTGCNMIGKIFIGNYNANGSYTRNTIIQGCNIRIDKSGSAFTFGKVERAVVTGCIVEYFPDDEAGILAISDDDTYDILMSDIKGRGFTYGWTSGGRTQNLDLANINLGSVTWYAAGGARYRNCKGAADTPSDPPMYNEVRRVDNVLKYWDGTAWQAM